MLMEMDKVEEESSEEEEQPCIVLLNVYEITPSNPLFCLLALGFGFYHTSVEVAGVEYSFRANVDGENESGIVTGPPHGLDLWESVIIGFTQMKTSQALKKIEILKQEFCGDSYNFFTRNCNHFSDRLCKDLTGEGIPAYLKRITKFGDLCNCLLPADDDSDEELTTEEIIDIVGNDDDQRSLVYINVYDANKVGSPLMRLLGVGFYRSTVEVHGREYAFRPKPQERMTEYIISAPAGKLEWCEGLKHRKSITIGLTELNAEQVSDLVFGLQDEFNLVSYHPFARNSHHFTDRVCRELTGNPIPSWVNRVTIIWPLCKCVWPPDDPEEL